MTGAAPAVLVLTDLCRCNRAGLLVKTMRNNFFYIPRVLLASLIQLLIKPLERHRHPRFPLESPWFPSNGRLRKTVSAGVPRVA